MRTWIGVLCSISLACGADVSVEHIREAATRSLALFQASQKTWYTKTQCNSCHHQYQPALAYRSAREHGIPFDEAIARADAVKAFAATDLDRAVQWSWIIEPAMDDAYRMVAADAAGVRPNLVDAVYARLLASRQDADGSWTSYHQRPPASYSSFTQTALVLRAIQLYSHPSQKADIAARIARARHWLLSHTPIDTEARTYQLLGLKWAGANSASLHKAAQALAATEQPDGGWNSLEGRASDAYSTGEVLVALHDAGGMSTTDPCYQRGLDYLLRTQMPDGSWHVATRLHPPAPVSPPYFESGYPYGHDQFLSAQGSLWAVMALARALGPARKAELPSFKEAEPSNLPSWAETILFGTTGEVNHLLAGGFDPNSATPAGTTALMMAAPDLAKMKLLLDRGANINARARTNYSALMVACQYGGSAAAIRFLLDRGAQVALPAGQKSQFNANPLFLAAYANNAQALPMLHAAGNGLDDKMVIIGTASMTPLLGAVRFGNMAAIRTLLDMGDAADQAEPNGITLLDRAVLSNQIDIAKLLITRGADVNHVDKLGMTPLLYAASIDFGDSGMIDLLLASGARPDAQTKQGLTALDLARQYNHTHLLASLESSHGNATQAAR
ncbi:MAG TPA: ankyrin repeat domain-containing protein [Bryobacteraceae bacterium]|nr:ankyrin repeat domain-containing protein [Bryobacteraceae bacterium]